MVITGQVLERAGVNVARMLTVHAAEIAEAFLKADDALTVTLSVEFKQKGEGIKIKTGINFVAERVKASSDDEVYPPTQIDEAIESARVERERIRKIGYTRGTWARLRSYRHR